MSRSKRPYLPGAIFHVTSRTQGREAWFTEPLRTSIASYIQERFGPTEAWLLAYAVMPNHLHLIVRQGSEPLGEVMQPLLRKVALLIHRATGREGHVFERRYRAHLCTDPDYARAAIAYTHLNPVRAGLCERPIDYPWTSHGEYHPDGHPGDVAQPAELALRLFASSTTAPLPAVRRDYARYIQWRMELDRWHLLAEAGQVHDVAPAAPVTVGGDAHWRRYFSPPLSASDPRCRCHGLPPNRPAVHDLRDIARDVLAQQGKGLTLEWVRGPSKCPAQVSARRTIIHRAIAAGHRRNRIARFLGISPAAITRTLAVRLSGSELDASRIARP